MSPRSILHARLRSLSVPTLAALGLVAVVIVGMFATMVVTVRSLDATSKAQLRNSEMTRSTLQLERTVVDLETGVRGYMLTDDTKFLEPYERGRGRIADELRDLRAFSPPSLRGRVALIDRDLTDYVASYTEPLVSGTRQPT